LNKHDANGDKARGFALARVGRFAEAARLLEVYAELLSAQIPRQREQRESLSELVRELRLDPETARHRLERWESQTIAALHLQPFAHLIDPDKIR
jgi:hypothetical protein